MKYHELTAKTNKSKKRVGRGISGGQGKTAGRGTKGQGARTGFSKKPGFEGGQNPLMQRLPKLPGFKSHRVRPETVTLSQIAALKVKTVDANVLANKALISSPYVAVKVLSNGEIKQPTTINLSAASAKAISAIESAGGDFNQTPRIARPENKNRKNEAKARKAKQKKA